GQGRGPTPGLPGMRQAAEANSIPAVVREARSSLVVLQKWLPRAELKNGSIRFPGEQIDLPIVHWSGGRLWAEASAPSIAQTGIIEADLPTAEDWQLSLRVRPEPADLKVSVQSDDSSVRVTGIILWRTNRLNVMAEFNNQGWL